MKGVPTTVALEQILRGARLRVTAPRLAVLAAVHAHPHADTDSVIGAVRTAAGLVRRIQPSGSVARYEARVGDNHHHVVCRSCGTIADIDCVVGEAPCLTASEDRGFVIDEAEVTYWGLCRECAGVPASV